MQYHKSISTIRGILGLSIQDFAQKVGLSKSFISRIEKEERKPSEETIKQIARKLDIPEKIFHLLALDSKNNDVKNAQDIGEIMLKLLKRNNEQSK